MGEKDAKVTTMVLKVDLDCQKCYKKVKKVLCKFPQIRDQMFDDKKNTVTIKVVCCSPEKIRDKLCYKGNGSIKSIEIKEPEKPKESAEKPKEAEKKKEPEMPKKVTFAEVAKDSDKKKAPEKAKEAAEKPKDAEKKKEPEKDKPKETADKPKQPAAVAPTPVKVVAAAHAVQGYPSMYPVSQYYDGFSAGPSYPMHGGAQQAQYIQYDGYYGRPVYDSWAGSSAGGYNYNQNYNHNHNHNYDRNTYEENPACAIM